MTHRNAPLTALGRQRAVAQVVVRGRPIAHVAAELRIARATLSKWVARYRAEGEAGLLDRPSAPATRPSRLPVRSEEHTSELQSRGHLVCRLLLEKKKTQKI